MVAKERLKGSKWTKDTIPCTGRLFRQKWAPMFKEGLRSFHQPSITMISLDILTGQVIDDTTKHES